MLDLKLAWKNKRRKLYKHGENNYLLLAVNSAFSKELEEEITQLRALGVPDEILTYPNILMVAFQYYRQRCNIADDSIGTSPLWENWLSRL